MIVVIVGAVVQTVDFVQIVVDFGADLVGDGFGAVDLVDFGADPVDPA